MARSIEQNRTDVDLNSGSPGRLWQRRQRRHAQGLHDGRPAGGADDEAPLGRLSHLHQVSKVCPVQVSQIKKNLRTGESFTSFLSSTILQARLLGCTVHEHLHCCGSSMHTLTVVRTLRTLAIAGRSTRRRTPSRRRGGSPWPQRTHSACSTSSSSSWDGVVYSFPLKLITYKYF